jgi:hypothetical protein
MGVYEGRGQLAKAVKDLTQKWHETKMSWTDQQAEEFEKRYIQQFEGDLRQAVTAMEHMASVLNQVYRDCE